MKYLYFYPPLSSKCNLIETFRTVGLLDILSKTTKFEKKYLIFEQHSLKLYNLIRDPEAYNYTSISQINNCAERISQSGINIQKWDIITEENPIVKKSLLKILELLPTDCIKVDKGSLLESILKKNKIMILPKKMEHNILGRIKNSEETVTKVFSKREIGIMYKDKYLNGRFIERVYPVIFGILHRNIDVMITSTAVNVDYKWIIPTIALYNYFLKSYFPTLPNLIMVVTSNILNASGKKIRQNKGNYSSLAPILNDYSLDTLRIALLLHSIDKDVKFDYSILKYARKFKYRLFNLMKFLKIRLGKESIDASRLSRDQEYIQEYIDIDPVNRTLYFNIRGLTSKIFKISSYIYHSNPSIEDIKKLSYEIIATKTLLF